VGVRRVVRAGERTVGLSTGGARAAWRESGFEEAGAPPGPPSGSGRGQKEAITVRTATAGSPVRPPRREGVPSSALSLLP